MKRKQKYKPKYKFRKSFPIRWKLCPICKREFRLEMMWKIKLITYTRYLMILSHKTKKYVCKDCTGDEVDRDAMGARLDYEWAQYNIIKPPPINQRPKDSNESKNA
ncbi:MAG: hypothetical protein KAS32_19495 [Candidatus Peribacteraceae bacterium]|nr:hypothetical protein [Candidatus Peribacteraceae bacterium]